MPHLSGVVLYGYSILPGTSKRLVPGCVISGPESRLPQATGAVHFTIVFTSVESGLKGSENSQLHVC